MFARWSSMQMFRIACLLALMFATMRAFGTLGSPGFRWMLPAGFVVMALLPWILLAPAGRRRIGLRPATSARWYGLAMLIGAGLALLCGGIGWVLFGNGPDNFYVSIAGNYRGTMPTAGMSLAMAYAIFTIPALLFSPIGEELFFRGFLQEVLALRWSPRAAVLAEASLFGLVHIVHHGLYWSVDGLAVRPASGLLWILLMAATGVTFAWLRARSGSIFPAIIAHMAFNAVMNAVIFLWLWP